MGKEKDKRYAGASLGGKSRHEFFMNATRLPEDSRHMMINNGRMQARNPAGIDRARASIAADQANHRAAAAATGSWIGSGDKKNSATKHLRKLSDEGYGAQNILQAADMLGIKSINSKNDARAIRERLQNVYDPDKFKGKDDDKDIDGYPEGPENVDRDAYDSGEKKSPIDEAKERSQRFKERFSGSYFKDDEQRDIDGYKDNPFSYS